MMMPEAQEQEDDQLSACIGTLLSNTPPRSSPMLEGLFPKLSST